MNKLESRDDDFDTEVNHRERRFLYNKPCLLSDLAYIPASKILELGDKESFEVEDMYRLHDEWKHDTVYNDFRFTFFDRVAKGKSMFFTYYYPWRWDIFKAIIFALISSACSIMIPFSIKGFVDWLNSPDSSEPSTSGKGWLFGSIIIVAALFKVMFKRRAMFVEAVAQNGLGISLRSLVFDKLATISSEATRYLDIGKISNVVSADVFHIQNSVKFFQFAFANPLVIVAITLYLWLSYNYICIAIPLIFMILNAIQIFSNKKVMGFLSKKKEIADTRSKFISEVISGIKNVKFQAWEKQVLDRVEKLREEECVQLNKYNRLRLILINMGDVGVPLCQLAFFYFYVIVYKGEIKLSDAYLVIALINQIAYPMKMFIWALELANTARISLGRISNVVKAPNQVKRQDDNNLPQGTINFDNYSGGWSSEAIATYFKANKDSLDSLALSNVNTLLQAGKCYAVIGGVGSGKTSLLLAILDDLITKKGSIQKNGSVAFVSQSAFLLNATIKDNILFFSKYDPELYKRVLVQSCLIDDLGQLSGGDMTEIGERGINLSGGQKQRISIARALYASKDIYLFDDALSALDAEVGKKIFVNAIKGSLKNKTVILVTHQTSVLPNVDEILLMKNGQLVLQGTHAEIKNNPVYLEYYQQAAEKQQNQRLESPESPTLQKRGSTNSGRVLRMASMDNISMHEASAEDINTHVQMDDDEFMKQLAALEAIIGDSTEKQRIDRLKAGEIMKAESRKKGSVSGKYFGVYVRNYGWVLFTMYFTLMAAFSSGRIIGDFWIGAWAKNSLFFTPAQYCIGFAIFNLIIIMLSILVNITHARGSSNLSLKMNSLLIKGVMKNKIEFFDTTPVGVIMNRFTKDLDILDVMMALVVNQFTMLSLQLLGIAILIIITVPFMIVLIIIALILSARLAKRLLRSNIDIKRLILVCTSPIISNISEALNGSSTVNSYNVWTKMRRQFVKNQNKLAVVEMHERLVFCYVFQCLDLICLGLMFCMLLFIILIKIYNVNLFKDSNVLALAITWMTVTSDIVPLMMWVYQELTAGISSVERIHDMSIAAVPEDNYDEPLPPHKNWPTTGHIEMKNVCVRYRDNLPLVIDNLSLDILNKEKIGIVGRTGSGKSSLILALKRMINFVKPEEKESFIKIDGSDIQNIGLLYFRPAAVLIPQDPFLLSGTVRSNIDPDSKHSDEEVVEVLKKTKIFNNLYETIQRISGLSAIDDKDELDQLNDEIEQDLYTPMTERQKLSKNQIDKEGNASGSAKEVLRFKVKEGGINLSQGQRQLLCIARAIISKPKILLMDEATSNIDSKTDQIIQRIIKTEFSDSTVITIAHRLNTIIQYDRVVVLAAGKMIDQGSPSAMLDRKGVFRDLVMELGEENFEKMKKYAKDRSLEPILD